MLDEARDGLVAVDETGRILEANTAAAHVLGYDRRSIVGKPLAALIALPDRRALRHALLDAEPTTLELHVLHGGTGYTFALRRLPGVQPPTTAVWIGSDDGQPPPPPPPPMVRNLELLAPRFPQAMVGLRDDLTVVFANARARALLGSAAVRIGAVFGARVPQPLRVVAERLVRVRLPVAATELDVGDGRILRVSGVPASSEEPAVLVVEDVSDRRHEERVMREFLRNAAHQLRTPLTGIVAAVETLQSGAKERREDRDHFLDHLQRHADRLSRLARGLLLLARTQVGELAPVDLVELRPLLDRLVREGNPHGDVRLHTDCPAGLMAIATRELLQEALAALLDNALAHTREGEVRISAAQLNGRVAITVSDTGPGILPEFVDRVFEPFFRLAPSGEGYGLGLPIAAQAIRSMGGEISVSSQVGAGTSFIVTLPSSSAER